MGCAKLAKFCQIGGVKHVKTSMDVVGGECVVFTQVTVGVFRPEGSTICLAQPEGLGFEVKNSPQRAKGPDICGDNGRPSK